MMKNQKILWVDDEIDFLKPQIIYLQQNNFDVTTSTNASDAFDLIKENLFDLILLDEMMPGIRGLDALIQMKKIRPEIPIILVTKSEEEELMDEAIGKNISAYLIKPVNNKQLLSVIKQTIQKNKLIEEQTTKEYLVAFNKISQEINLAYTPDEWINLAKELAYWELRAEQTNSSELIEYLNTQRDNANLAFANFIENNYLNWFENDSDRPLMSQTILSEKLFPHLAKNNSTQTVLILIDNFRYDHWRAVSQLVANFFKIKEETLFYSILPTTTQYSRNSIFSGLMPSEIKKLYPQYWYDDEEDEHKNMHEEELLSHNLSRHGIKTGFYFRKIFNNSFAEKVNSELHQILNHKLSVIIYNFIDILSHKQTNDQTLKELAGNEISYRSLATSWFKTSPIIELLQMLAENNVNVFITTDHGSIRIKKPVKVIGYKETSTNIRYKQGKALSVENSKDERNIFTINNPDAAKLPKPHPSSKYIFAKNDYYLVYPNNYNEYVKKFKNSFQHGGVSIEEMLIPFISLIPK